jgi:beta-glucosidase
VPERAFADWQDGWHFETGAYLLEVGTSVTDLPLSGAVTLN